MRPEAPTQVRIGPSDLRNHFQHPDHDLTVVAITCRPFGPLRGKDRLPIPLVDFFRRLKTTTVEEKHRYRRNHISCSHQHSESRLIISLHQLEKEFTARCIENRMPDGGKEPELVSALEKP